MLWSWLFVYGTSILVFLTGIFVIDFELKKKKFDLVPFCKKKKRETIAKNQQASLGSSSRSFVLFYVKCSVIELNVDWAIDSHL